MNDTLYRKYRPVDFDGVMGQDHIVTTLKNQILTNKVGHAYLFCGTRGTGKTSVAKIFARAVNCQNRKGANPCNECESCLQSLENHSINIVEMDAASNRGIDNIRNLKNEIEYAPLNGDKYKVYILDEVHELSKDAFNALLKTLEEPPEYVIFILATTNVEMLPETILSRCQRYNFNRISLDTMVDNLVNIAKLENINIDKEAITYIAEKSDGSMRDSISKLDRCRLIDENTVLTRKRVADILGLVDDEVFKDLLFSVINKKIENIASIISSSLDGGKDILQFLNDFIWHIRNVLISKDLPEVNDALNITKEHFLELKDEAETYSRMTLIYYIRELSKVVNVMRYDENRRVTLEANLIKLAVTESAIDEEGIIARIENIEQKLENANNNSYNYQTNSAAAGKNKPSDKTKINSNNNDNSYQKQATVKSDTDKKTEEIKSAELSTIEKNFKEIYTELTDLEKTMLKKCDVLLKEEKDNDKKILNVLFSIDALDFFVIGGEEKIKELALRMKDIIKEKFNIDSKILFKKVEKVEKDKTLDEITDAINNAIKD